MVPEYRRPVDIEFPTAYEAQSFGAVYARTYGYQLHQSMAGATRRVRICPRHPDDGSPDERAANVWVFYDHQRNRVRFSGYETIEPPQVFPASLLFF